MALEWERQTLKYLDKGTVYLSQEQEQSFRLVISHKVLSQKGQGSFSFLRVPQQTVLGYVTGSSNGRIVFEHEIRFFSEIVYDHTDSTTYLKYLFCKLSQQQAGNLVAHHIAIPSAIPLEVGQNEQGISPGIRNLDTVRFNFSRQTNFEIYLSWISQPPDVDNCKSPPSNEPPPLPPSKEPREPTPEQNPNIPVPPPTESAPRLPDNSDIPLNARPGDFGQRNIETQPPEPIAGRYKVFWSGNLVAGDGSAAPTPLSGSDFITGTPPFVAAKIDGQGGSTQFGAFEFYRINGVSGSWSGGGWYSFQVDNWEYSP